ncbi:hypothetical protein Tco_1423422 [Tanacetum coccineum]
MTMYMNEGHLPNDTWPTSMEDTDEAFYYPDAPFTQRSIPCQLRLAKAFQRGAWIAVYQEDHRVLGSRRSYKLVRRSDKFIRVAHAGTGVVPDVPTNLGWGGNHLPPGCIDKWSELRKRFMARFAILRACFKTEITKITQKANETLQALLSKNVGHMRVVISWTCRNSCRSPRS